MLTLLTCRNPKLSGNTCMCLSCWVCGNLSHSYRRVLLFLPFPSPDLTSAPGTTPLSLSPLTAKALERMGQPVSQISSSSLSNPLQSGSRSHHPSETVPIKDTSDISATKSSGNFSVLSEWTCQQHLAQLVTLSMGQFFLPLCL